MVIPLLCPHTQKIQEFPFWIWVSFMNDFFSMDIRIAAGIQLHLVAARRDQFNLYSVALRMCENAHWLFMNSIIDWFTNLFHARHNVVHQHRVVFFKGTKRRRRSNHRSIDPSREMIKQLTSKCHRTWAPCELFSCWTDGYVKICLRWRARQGDEVMGLLGDHLMINRGKCPVDIQYFYPNVSHSDRDTKIK